MDLLASSTPADVDGRTARGGHHDKDEINARIKDCQVELAGVKKALTSTGARGGVSTDQLSDLNRRQAELETEIAALKAMLDEL